LLSLVQGRRPLGARRLERRGFRVQSLWFRSGFALGASPVETLKLILRKGIGLALLGVVAGVVLSGLTVSTMASLLCGVHPRNPAVFLEPANFGCPWFQDQGLLAWDEGNDLR